MSQRQIRKTYNDDPTKLRWEIEDVRKAAGAFIRPSTTPGTLVPSEDLRKFAEKADRIASYIEGEGEVFGLLKDIISKVLDISYISNNPFTDEIQRARLVLGDDFPEKHISPQIT